MNQREIISDARRVAALLDPPRRRDFVRIKTPLRGLNPRSQPRIAIVVAEPDDDGLMSFVLADDRRSVGLCLASEVEKLDRRPAKGRIPTRDTSGALITKAAQAVMDLDLEELNRIGKRIAGGFHDQVLT